MLNSNLKFALIPNLSSKIQKTRLNKFYNKWKNIIGPKIKIEKDMLILEPFETIWLSNR